MLDLTRDVKSLSAFLRNAKAMVAQLRKSGQPLVLTVNGEAELVVLTVEAYQRIAELADRMDTLLAVRRGLDDADAGRGRPFEEAFDELIMKHGIQSSDDRRSGTTD